MDGPFREAMTNSVTPADSFEAFDVIRKYLYCLPIDMSLAPSGLALIAHRWELATLFEASFAWAEVSREYQPRQLVENWMTVLSLVQPPQRFCSFFSRQFAMAFDKLEQWLASENWKWGSETIWEIFLWRGMMLDIIRQITLYASNDYSELFLDLILRQLAPRLQENKIQELLNQLDWSSASCATALTGPRGEKWSKQSWRLLALTPKPGFRVGGEDMRMRWQNDSFGSDYHDVPMAVSSEKFLIGGLRFSLSLVTWCWAEPLSLRIRLSNRSKISHQEYDRIRVSARVNVTEGGCACGLESRSKIPIQEFTGVPVRDADVASWPLKSFAIDEGVEFVIMSVAEFETWRNQHKRCGLTISVRLRMDRDECDMRRGGEAATDKAVASYERENRKRIPNDLRKRMRDQAWQIGCPCNHCRKYRYLYRPGALARSSDESLLQAILGEDLGAHSASE